jgi:hypothetical protein
MQSIQRTTASSGSCLPSGSSHLLLLAWGARGGTFTHANARLLTHSSSRFSAPKAKNPRWRFGQQRFGCESLPIIRGLPFPSDSRDSISLSTLSRQTSSHTPRGSPPAPHRVHIHVPLVTRTSLPPVPSDNTLLQAEVPTKHVASPSNTALNDWIDCTHYLSLFDAAPHTLEPTPLSPPACRRCQVMHRPR